MDDHVDDCECLDCWRVLTGGALRIGRGITYRVRLTNSAGETAAWNTPDPGRWISQLEPDDTLTIRRSA